jgi:acetyl-CoA carboxylase biotin carboxyl carrier protein
MKQVVASMAGTVIQVLAAVGDQVEAGQDVVLLESMKMEVPISAVCAGTVSEIKSVIGDFVNEGDVLLVLD